MKITFDDKYYYLKDIKHESFIRAVAEILNDIVCQDEELLFRIQIPSIERIMDATRKFMQENNLAEEDCIVDEDEIKKEQIKIMSFVETKVQCINFEQVMRSGFIDDKTPIMWYQASNLDEIQQSILLKQYFCCIIRKKNTDFSDYLFAFAYDEGDEEEYMVIQDCTENGVYSRILPNIEKHFGKVIP